MWISLAIVWGVCLGSLVSLCLSVWCAYTTRKRHRHRTLEKQLNALELEQIESLDRLAKIQYQVKKIVGRESVRKHRQNGKADENTGEETDDDWKLRMSREFGIKKAIGS